MRNWLMPPLLRTLVFLICKMGAVTARHRVGHSGGCREEPFQEAALCTRAGARAREWMLVKHSSCSSSLSPSPVPAGGQWRVGLGSGVGLPASEPAHQPADLRGKPAHLFVPWFCHLYNGAIHKVPPSKSRCKGGAGSSPTQGWEEECGCAWESR